MEQDPRPMSFTSALKEKYCDDSLNEVVYRGRAGKGSAELAHLRNIVSRLRS